MVRQLLAQGLLAVQGEYQTLAITEAAGEVLRGQRVVTLRRDMPQPRGARASSRGAAGASPVAAGAGKLAAADLSPEQEAVFEKLRAWRGATAKEQSVPGLRGLPRRDAAGDRGRRAVHARRSSPGSTASASPS